MATTKQAKRSGNGGTDGAHRTVKPTSELAAMIGDGALTRSEAVKKIWDYIKSNDLQDPKDRRQIRSDAKLEKVLGKKQVSMFEMNKHLFAHLKPMDG